MSGNKLDQLYGSIQARYDFGEGAHVRNAIKTQCSTFYRHWRERLKAEYFSNCKTLLEAERNCPRTINIDQWKWLIYNYWNLSKQRERSEKNRSNAYAKKIKSACGAKSIARTIYELELEVEVANQGEDEIDVNTSNDDPMYIKLWEKTKRHKDGNFDDEAELKLKEFRDLHKKEIEENGSDRLTVEEAYERALGYRSGYARGLGKGHPVLSKNGKKGRAELESNVEQLQAENNAMRAENNVIRAELQESKMKQQDLERKLQLIMEKIGLKA